MINLQKQEGSYYASIIDNLKGLYIRDMLEYFCVSWEYNSKLKKEMPSLSISFLPQYFKQSEREIDNYVQATESCHSREELLRILSADLRYCIRKGLLGESQSYRLPDVQQTHMPETIDLVANLFAERKIKSFRFGADLRDTRSGTNRHLTLEMVTNKGDVLKSDCGLLKHFNHAMFREHILESVR
jgi:hypothetical protein